MYALAPNGKLIIGTADLIPALGYVHSDSFVRNANGTLTAEHTGRSRVYWDGQEREKHDNQPVYLDETGEEWRADQITLLDAMPKQVARQREKENA